MTGPKCGLRAMAEMPAPGLTCPGLTYLATTVGARTLQQALADTGRIARALRAGGRTVFAPLEAFTPAALVSHLDPCDATLWWPASKPFLARAGELVVPLWPGIDRSPIVALELQHARDRGLPLWWVAWPELTLHREGPRHVTGQLAVPTGTPRGVDVPQRQPAMCGGGS